MSSLSSQVILEAAQITMQAASYCFLITLNSIGRVDARLMQHFPADPDLTLWFGTSRRSRKVRQVLANPHVTVAFMHPDGSAYVIVSGNAEIIETPDLRQEYWHKDWIAFFPGGALGDDYLLLRVVPERIEVMDFNRNISPPPYGLMPGVLVRRGENWIVEGEVEQ